MASDNDKTSEFLIKDVEPTDLEFIKNLETEARLCAWSMADYKAEIENPESIFLIIKRGSERIGFILARLIIIKQEISSLENEKTQETICEIYNVAIRNEFRNHNLGSRLLTETFRRGAVRGLSKVFLEVRESNQKAIKFYEKNKFSIIGTRKNFYTNPSENALVMSRRVP